MNWSGNLALKVLIAILVILLLMLQYRLWFGKASIPKVIHLKQQLASQVQENKKLQQRNAVLIAEVQDLKSGHQAIEERARNELGMVKKGETFYQIVK